MQSQPFVKEVIAESIDDGAYRNLDMRGTQEPIPINLEYFLSDGQLNTVHSLEADGWRLLFVRRPLFEPPTVVIEDSNSGQLAAVETDGSLNLEPPTLLRV